MNYRESISKAIVQTMERDPKVVLLGQNVTAPHGVFGTTTEAYRRFPGRVLETPISETMLTGACVGLAMEGWKPIYVHPRCDWSTLSFEHLINTAAKLPFLRGKPLPFVMRVVVGRGWGQGPVHSQSFHHLLAQIPGLNITLPAYGSTYPFVLEHGLRYQPTVIIEPRRLYESTLERAEESSVTARIATADIILFTYGDAVLDALEAKSTLNSIGVYAHVWPVEMQPMTVPLPKKYLVVDMVPRRPTPNLVAPPFIPQGVSPIFEKAWYPTASDIVAAACKLLGMEPPQEVEHDYSRTPIAGAF